MKREARDFRERMPRPVRRIPLEEGSLRRRIIGAGIALVVAGLALFIALRTMTRVDAGWAWIEPDSAEGPTAEVRLWAELGAGEESPLTERKKLTALYSGAARELYTLFSPYEIFSGVNNLWWINHHPNEEVTVDPRLYSALEKCAGSGRGIYFGPVYEIWDGVYFSQTDQDARIADPREGAANAAALAEILAALQDESQISLSFLGQGMLRLNVSEQLLRLAEEEGIERFLDFGWMQNACAADELARVLTEAGWTRGVLVSQDGFIRCLDGRDSFVLEILSTLQGKAVRNAEARYRGPAALMQLIPAPRGERARSYLYADGTLRTAWISREDGLDRQPVDSLSTVSRTKGCLDMALEVWPLLTEEEFRPQALEALAEPGEISLIAIRDNRIYCAGEGFEVLKGPGAAKNGGN